MSLWDIGVNEWVKNTSARHCAKKAGGGGAAYLQDTSVLEEVGHKKPNLEVGQQKLAGSFIMTHSRSHPDP